MDMLSGSLLPFFAVVRAEGEDRAAFLHSQLSNDIAHLPAGHACYATYNTPKGRVVANMLVLNRGEDMLLLLAADVAAAVVKRLSMYVLRSKVRFTHLPDWSVAGWPGTDSTPPAPSSIAPLDFAAREENGVWLLPPPQGPALCVGETGALPPHRADIERQWQLQALSAGVPWISAATSETSVAQMLNQHRNGAVHFKKGCYPGQEIIARAQYRGQVKRGLVLLGAHTALAAGDKLVNEAGEEAGLVINAVTHDGASRALAVVKFAAVNAPVYTADHIPMEVHHVFFELPPS
ncbi:folate-binding protein YgfZ [Neisseria sp. HSC-16F19]|nr:folate-binding protein [Neisseria sp. HSC-16F19]MCP2041419.1 folate-binding protein YgfZ [Neisseria sp. HSC-16F19]